MSITQAQLRRRGMDNKLIMENFLNGVRKDRLAVDFSKSVTEVERTIAFVAKKISEYRHQHCLKPNKAMGMLPPIPCSTEEDIILNADALRWTLDKIGPETLASELLIPGLTTHTLGQDSKLSDVQEAAHAVRSRTVPIGMAA